MKKLPRFSLLTLIVLLFQLHVGTMQAADPAHTVKIGVVLCLSGDLAYFGESYRNAMLMAKEEHSPTKLDYQFIFEDCSYSGTKAALAFQKLINVDKVDCLLSFFDIVGQVGHPLAEQHHIVLLGYAINPNIAKGSYNFLHTVTADDESRVFCDVLKKRGIKNISIFTIKDVYSMMQKRALTEQLQKENIKISSDFEFGPNEKDFRTLIVQAAAEKPDIYCLLTFTPTLEILSRQMREAKINALGGLETFENTDQPKMYEGLWYVSPVNPNDNFMERFRKKYNAPTILGTGHAYDMYNLMVDAYEQNVSPTGKPTSEQIAATLREMKTFTGVMGTAVNNHENIFRCQAAEKIIKNGEPVMVK